MLPSTWSCPESAGISCEGAIGSLMGHVLSERQNAHKGCLRNQLIDVITPVLISASGPPFPGKNILDIPTRRFLPCSVHPTNAAVSSQQQPSDERNPHEEGKPQRTSGAGL